MKRKILSILLLIGMIFNITPIAFADEVEPFLENDVIAEYTVPILSEEEATEYFNKQEIPQDARGITFTNLYMFLVRSGDTEKVHLYWGWNGTMLINSIAAEEIIIKHSSEFNTKQYYHYIRTADPATKQWDVVAAKTGTAPISYNLSIPTNQTAVKMVFKGPLVYNVHNAAWTAATPYSGKVDIQ